jgi:hypothetical protein
MWLMRRRRRSISPHSGRRARSDGPVIKLLQGDVRDVLPSLATPEAAE